MGSVAGQSDAYYEITLAESGEAQVQLRATGGAIEVPLPEDARAQASPGAQYSLAEGKLLLRAPERAFAALSFQTSRATTKIADGWAFALALSNAKTNFVLVHLPKRADVLALTPESGVIVSREASVDVQWVLSQTRADPIALEYHLAIPAAATQERGPLSQNLWLVGLALLVALASGIAYQRLKNKPAQNPTQATSPPAPKAQALAQEATEPPLLVPAVSQPASKAIEATEGMRNVMHALTQTDVRIIEALLDEAGELRRAELERKLGIAKSSLALALDRLEERKLLKIDREAVFQRVRLSEWFRAL